MLQVEYISKHTRVVKQHNRRRDVESKYNEAAVLYRQTESSSNIKRTWRTGQVGLRLTY